MSKCLLLHSDREKKRSVDYLEGTLLAVWAPPAKCHLVPSYWKESRHLDSWILLAPKLSRWMNQNQEEKSMPLYFCLNLSCFFPTKRDNNVCMTTRKPADFWKIPVGWWDINKSSSSCSCSIKQNPDLHCSHPLWLWAFQQVTMTDRSKTMLHFTVCFNKALWKYCKVEKHNELDNLTCFNQPVWWICVELKAVDFEFQNHPHSESGLLDANTRDQPLIQWHLFTLTSHLCSLTASDFIW